MPQVKQGDAERQGVVDQVSSGFILFVGMFVAFGMLAFVMGGLSKASDLVLGLPVIAVGIFVVCVLYTILRVFQTGVWFPLGFGVLVSVGGGIGYTLNMANVQAGLAAPFTVNLLAIVPWAIFGAWVGAALMAAFSTPAAAE